MFDEQALLADVVGVWGNYGAHADLVKYMIREITNLRIVGDDLATCALHGDAEAIQDAVDLWDMARGITR